MPVDQEWQDNRAVLLVHGIGNAGPGDYAGLTETIRAALGDAGETCTFYELYYDFVNDWFKDKLAFADRLQQAKLLFKIRIGDADLSETVSEYAADVLWPVLSRSARAAVREAYLLQLKQIVRDGIAAGYAPPRQKLTVIAHSLGCFHTYEALHAAASRPTHVLQPYTDGVRFENVILMAPPIQLIRTMGNGLGPAVPFKNELRTFDEGGLSLPGQRHKNNRFTASAKNWVSMVGELDPVGGYFFRKRADWAYTSIDGQISIIDPQTALAGSRSKAGLVKVLAGALSEKSAPDIKLNNPHSWEGYITRHETELQQWLNA